MSGSGTLKRQQLKFTKSESWKSFQFSLSSDQAYAKAETKIKNLLADALRIAAARAAQSNVPASPTEGAPISGSSSPKTPENELFDNTSLWETEAILMEQAKAKSSEELKSSARHNKKDSSSFFEALFTRSENNSGSTTPTKEGSTSAYEKDKDKQEDKLPTDFDCSWFQLNSIPPDIGELTWLQVFDFVFIDLTS
jgi:hypothetical protein